MARPMDMTAEFHFLAYYLHFVVRELFINVIYLLYCLFAIGKGREKKYDRVISRSGFFGPFLNIVFFVIV